MGLYSIDFNKISKYTDTNIFNHLCKIEINIAKENRRFSTTIKQKDISTPIYDVDTNEISIPSIISRLNIIKLTASIVHEAEHANQEFSSLKTQDEKTLLTISSALYPNDTNKNFASIQYICNYKEMGARLAEAKCIINLYNMALNQVRILNKELAQDFKDAIGNTIEYITPINHKNLRFLQKWNKRSIKQNEYNKKYTKNLSQKDILNFLKKTAPKMYRNIYREIKTIRQELQKIYDVLEYQYSIVYDKTSAQITKINEKESARQHAETDKMQTDGMIKYIHSMPEGEFEENTYDYFDDFKEFVKKTIDSKKTDKVYVDIDWNNEIFKTYTQSKDEKTFADGVLDNNYIPEITTNHDEMDISK